MLFREPVYERERGADGDDGGEDHGVLRPFPPDGGEQVVDHGKPAPDGV